MILPNSIHLTSQVLTFPEACWDRGVLYQPVKIVSIPIRQQQKRPPRPEALPAIITASGALGRGYQTPDKTVSYVPVKKKCHLFGFCQIISVLSQNYLGNEDFQSLHN